MSSVRKADLCAEICNVSSGQQVIDVDKELFLHNLIVSHQECDWDALDSSLHSQHEMLRPSETYQSSIAVANDW